MKNLYLVLLFFSTFLYAMDDPVEATVANNQKTVLTKAQLKRLALSSAMLKNAAQDFNDENLPTDFPFIENPAALIRITNLLNDDGTPNREECLAQKKGDWCTMAPALAALDIECFNPYILAKLENAYSSPIFCKAVLNNAARSFSYETLPPTFKNELARRINQENVEDFPQNYSVAQTIRHLGKITTVAITSDGKTFGSAGVKKIKLWSLNTDKTLRLKVGKNPKNLNTGKKLRKLHNLVAIVSDNKIIISTFLYNRFHLWNWDLQSDFPCKPALSLDYNTSLAAISPDCRTLVSCSDDDTIKIWDLQTGSLHQTLQGHNDIVTAVAITSDRQTFISASKDDSIKFWDLNTGSPRQTLKGHKNCIKALAISPDGQTLVSGSHDRTIKLWDLNTGFLRQTLKGYQPLPLRDSSTGSLPKTSQGHKNEVNSVAISRDGQIIVSSSYDQTIKIWRPNISFELKKELLHIPLEQALLIQALRTRPNSQEQFFLQGKAREYFKKLRPDAQIFLSKELNVKPAANINYSSCIENYLEDISNLFNMK